MARDERLRFECDNCCAGLLVDRGHSGVRARCSGCGAPVTVPWEGGRAFPFEASDSLEDAWRKTASMLRARRVLLVPLSSERLDRFGRMGRGGMKYFYVSPTPWTRESAAAVEEEFLATCAESFRPRAFRFVTPNPPPARLSLLFDGTPLAFAERSLRLRKSRPRPDNGLGTLRDHFGLTLHPGDSTSVELLETFLLERVRRGDPDTRLSALVPAPEGVLRECGLALGTILSRLPGMRARWIGEAKLELNPAGTGMRIVLDPIDAVRRCWRDGRREPLSRVMELAIGGRA